MFRAALIGPDNCGKKTLVLSSVLKAAIQSHSPTDNTPPQAHTVSSEQLHVQQLHYASSSLWRCRVSCSVEAERDNVVLHGLTHLATDKDSDLDKSSDASTAADVGGGLSLRPLLILTAVPQSIQEYFLTDARAQGLFDSICVCFSLKDAGPACADQLARTEDRIPRNKPIIFVQTCIDLAQQSMPTPAQQPSQQQQQSLQELSNDCTTRSLMLLQRRSGGGGWFGGRSSSGDVVNCSSTTGVGLWELARALSEASLRHCRSPRFRPPPRSDASSGGALRRATSSVALVALGAVGTGWAVTNTETGAQMWQFVQRTLLGSIPFISYAQINHLFQANLPNLPVPIGAGFAHISAYLRHWLASLEVNKRG